MSHIHAGRELFLEEMRDLRVDVSRETRDQLEALVYTLGRWQKAINLVGKTTLDEVWTRHILDSAQLAPADPKGRQDTGRPRAAAAAFQAWFSPRCAPTSHVTLIELDARKGAFLGEAGRRMGLKSQPKDRHQPDRSCAASQSRCHHGPGARSPRPAARLGNSSPFRYRYLSFPQGERLASRIDRGHERLGHSIPVLFQRDRP